MNIEEKAKAYDEALKKARQLCCYPTTKPFISDLQDLFPELKGSEDEKIRKAILEHIQLCTESIPDRDKFIDWLEKQGEKKGNNKSIWKHWSTGVAGNGDGKPIYLIKNYNTYSLSSCLSFECDYILLSDLDKLLPQRFEMKSAEESLGISSEEYNDIVNECLYGESKPADKVESKFKVGDWVINSRFKNSRPIKIISISLTKGYELIGNENGDKEFFLSKTIVETEYHLWTIEDAKDGDVLACPLPKGYEAREQIFIFKGINSRDYVDNCIEYYCHICDGVFYENENGLCYMGTTSTPLYPATKSQHDALFKAMTDAGYIFDFEKKELKKISQRMVSAEAKEALYDKLTWNEEDEKMIDKIRSIVEKYAFSQSAVDVNGDLCEKKYIDADNWLKTLKDRAQSKQEWSEEDECYMSECIGAIATKDGWSFEEKRKTKHWLESLKDRYTWKPSDEQIEALGMATDICSIPEKYYTELNKLYYDLKKLK